MEWFIVAFISFAGTDQVKIKLMQEGFSNKPACVQYLKDTPEVVNDIMKMEPNNIGMSFTCLDRDQVAYYKVKRQAI